MKWLVLLLALAACVETHDGSKVEIASRDCSECHSATLQHPEDAFPLMTMGTKHTGIECWECHRFERGPGLEGVHADCTGLCHLQRKDSFCCSAIEPDHVGRVSPIDGTTPYAWDATNHDFCLGCHPTGVL